MLEVPAAATGVGVADDTCGARDIPSLNSAAGPRFETPCQDSLVEACQMELARLPLTAERVRAACALVKEDAKSPA